MRICNSVLPVDHLYSNISKLSPWKGGPSCAHSMELVTPGFLSKGIGVGVRSQRLNTKYGSAFGNLTMGMLFKFKPWFLYLKIEIITLYTGALESLAPRMFSKIV